MLIQRASNGDRESQIHGIVPSCDKAGDGRLLFQADYTDRENLLTWLLSFREKAEILEPADLREELRRTLLKTLEHYKEDKET